MADKQSRAFLPGHFHLLSHAFEHATKGLSEKENIPAIKACLADKVLTLVASGEGDAVRLSAAALATMRECLLTCEACKPDTAG